MFGAFDAQFDGSPRQGPLYSEPSRNFAQDTRLLWSERNWYHWLRGGQAIDHQVQAWIAHGTFNADFPSCSLDDQREQRVWEWLMDVPKEDALSDVGTPDAILWTDGPVPEDQLLLPPAQPELQDVKREGSPQAYAQDSAIDLSSPESRPWTSQPHPRGQMAGNMKPAADEDRLMATTGKVHPAWGTPFSSRAVKPDFNRYGWNELIDYVTSSDSGSYSSTQSLKTSDAAEQSTFEDLLDETEARYWHRIK